MVLGDFITSLHRQEYTIVAAGIVHRIEDPGPIPPLLTEIKKGEYLGEHDILRFEGNDGSAPKEARARASWGAWEPWDSSLAGSGEDLVSVPGVRLPVGPRQR